MIFLVKKQFEFAPWLTYEPQFKFYSAQDTYSVNRYTMCSILKQEYLFSQHTYLFNELGFPLSDKDMCEQNEKFSEKGYLFIDKDQLADIVIMLQQ